MVRSFNGPAGWIAQTLSHAGRTSLEHCAENSGSLSLKMVLKHSSNHPQTGTLREYITEFRKLANHTSEVGPILLKSCFVGGLKRELKFDVKLLKRKTVCEAIETQNCLRSYCCRYSIRLQISGT